MATIASNLYTLTDWVRSRNPDESQARIIDMLSQQNEIVKHLQFMEGNLTDGHQTTLAASLPSVAWNTVNGLITPSTVTTTQAKFRCGMLTTAMEVPKLIADLGGNPNAFRAARLPMYMEALAQEAASSIFYGDETLYPERFNGLTKYFNSVSTGTNQTARNVIDGGGTGSDNSSIWLVGWGEGGLWACTPKGYGAGITHINKGVVDATVVDANGIVTGIREVYRDLFYWSFGLVLEDWRNVARICNIDASALRAGSGADLLEKMRLMTTVINKRNLNYKIYAPRYVYAYLKDQVWDHVKGGGGLSFENIDSVPTLMFEGYPIYLLDKLTEAEARVT